jgi:hypothetical protein
MHVSSGQLPTKNAAPADGLTQPGVETRSPVAGDPDAAAPAVAVPAAALSPWPRLAAVAVWAVAFAVVEAMVVFYLRRLFMQQFALTFTPASFHFPYSYLPYEQAREAATMVMLLAVAWIAGRTRWQRFAYWLLAFGVWDIFYYVWLYVMLRWPSSPGSRDLLFLIPVEWWAPVWQPVLASCGFIAVAVFVLARTRRA